MEKGNTPYWIWQNGGKLEPILYYCPLAERNHEEDDEREWDH